MDWNRINRWIEPVFWALIIPFSFWFLFKGITHENLWYDESYTAAIIRHSFSDIWKICGGDSHPPFYYLALKLISMIFGESLEVLRGFSALGTISLILLGLGPIRKIFGRYPSMSYAAFILAVPGTLIMSQETRMYTWSAFLVTSAVLFGYLAVTENKIKDWVLFGVCALLAAYTHYFAFLPVLLSGAVIAIYLSIFDRKTLPVFGIVAGSAAVLYLPWALQLLHQAGRLTKDFWIPPLSLDSFNQSVSYIFGYKFSNPPVYPAFLLFLLTFGLGIYGVFQSIQNKKPESRALILLLTVWVLTIFTAAAASIFIRPMLIGRYTFPIIGLLFIPAAYGLTQIKRTGVLVPIALLFLFFNLPQIATVESQRFNGSLDEIIDFIHANSSPGESILFTDEHAPGMVSYQLTNYRNYFYLGKNFHLYSDYRAFAPFITWGSNYIDFIGTNKTFWLVTCPGQPGSSVAREILGTGAFKPAKISANFHNGYGFLMMMAYKLNVLDSFTNLRDKMLSGDTANFVKKGSGNIIVKLYNLRKNPNPIYIDLHISLDRPEGGFRTITNHPNGRILEAVFSNVPYGYYAATAYHDENGNGKFDMEGGKAAEGLGIVGHYSDLSRKPEFEETKFLLESKETNIEFPICYQ